MTTHHGYAAWALHLLLKLRAVLMLFILVAIFSALSPTFFTANNLSILAKHVSINALLAVGMTFVILTGGIDLSVGSIAGLCGIIAGQLITGISYHGSTHYPPVLIVISISLLAGAVAGACNGLLVARFTVAPFIATLGMLYIARGTALLLSGGHTFPDLAGSAAHHNMGFPALGQSFFIGIPTPVWITLILAALAAIVAARTPFGRHVYAVGGNERASRLAGIDISRVKLIAYIVSGAFAALAGLIVASQLESAHPATGESFELNAIAAVVLGGTSLMGGRGSIGGSLIGALVIGVLADGLVMLGVSEFWQIVIKGVVIVLAVAVDQLQSRAQFRFLSHLFRGSSEAIQ
jgi:erythritol transport system permease protein